MHRLLTVTSLLILGLPHSSHAQQAPATSCSDRAEVDTAIYEISDLHDLPNHPPLRRTAPPLDYPKEDQRAHIEGTVMVEGIISAHGTVEPGSLRVRRSVSPGLDSAAVRFYAQTTWWPGCKDGNPVRVRVQQPVIFSLRRGG